MYKYLKTVLKYSTFCLWAAAECCYVVCFVIQGVRWRVWRSHQWSARKRLRGVASSVTLKALGTLIGGRAVGRGFTGRVQEVGGATVTVGPPKTSKRKWNANIWMSSFFWRKDSVFKFEYGWSIKFTGWPLLIIFLYMFALKQKKKQLEI